MKIQFNTDKNIDAGEEFRESLISIISGTLKRFKNHVTRLEVHLSDENSGKSGPNDKRCLLEARIENRKPVAVTDEAESYIEAAAGAANKLKMALDSMIGRMQEKR
jgi:hypothetical protein